jgi:hypothetical protein
LTSGATSRLLDPKEPERRLAVPDQREAKHLPRQTLER